MRTDRTPAGRPRSAAGSAPYSLCQRSSRLTVFVSCGKPGDAKEIARALKMPPSAVAPLIRSVAAAEGRTREDALIGGWISPGWSSSVQAPERPDWPGSAPSDRAGHSGLVTVLAARDRGGSTAGVCFYLVDTWCLGLKDAAGPRPVDRRRLGGFIQQIFSAWDEPAVQVPLELGRQSSTAQWVRAGAGVRAARGLRPGRRVSGGMGRAVRADLRPGRQAHVHLRAARRQGRRSSASCTTALATGTTTSCTRSQADRTGGWRSCPRTGSA